MRQKLPLVLSATALVVAVLGTTQIGAVAQGVVFPRNSIGTPQLKKDAVVSLKVKNGSLLAVDFKPGQLPAGPQGAKGDKGDKGDAGPPGTARAYGHIVADGTLDASRDHSGIVSSRRDGSYICVKLEATIDAAKASPSVTLDFAGNFKFTTNGHIGWAAAFATPCTSGQNEVRIATGTYGATENSGGPVVSPGPFFLVIP